MVSAAGLIGAFGQANYAAAKLGMTALSKSIAIDMKRYNVRSNCISPVAWSRMVSSIPTDTPEQKARVAKKIGRASVRERGCKYVEISVVAVALKKNTI